LAGYTHQIGVREQIQRDGVVLLPHGRQEHAHQHRKTLEIACAHPVVLQDAGKKSCDSKAAPPNHMAHVPVLEVMDST